MLDQLGAMRRLVADGESFEPISPHVIADPEFEAILVKHSALLYPDYEVVRVRISFDTATGITRPHLALISKKYFDWWLVVLECGNPPSSKAVKEEATKIRSAAYDAEFIATICDRNKKIDPVALKALSKRATPNTFMLIGRPPAPEIADETIRVGILEVFSSATSGKRILRINGVHPSAPSEELTTCTRDEMVGDILVVADPAAMGPWPSDSCQIRVGDCVVDWTRHTDTNGMVLITADSACPLPPGAKDFRLVKSPSGLLELIAL